MHVIEQSARYVKKDDFTPTQFVELIGRTCYKSEDKMKEGSDKRFIFNLVNSKHYAMIEHFWVHARSSVYTYQDFIKGVDDFNTAVSSHTGYIYDRGVSFLKHIQVSDINDSLIISFPIRVAVEALDKTFKWNVPLSESKDCIPIDRGNPFFHLLLDTLRLYPDFFPFYQCDEYNKGEHFPTYGFFDDECLVYTLKKAAGKSGIETDISRHLTHTVMFTTDRGVSHEFVRHRLASFAQESTRYCNYSKDKFDHGVTFIKPSFFYDLPYPKRNYQDWLSAMKNAEDTYFKLLERTTPQEARTVLPNSVKTELVITANETEWQHILNLRYWGKTGSPHPQIREAMELARPYLVEASDGRLC